jgi:hypothetical protein
MLWCFFQVVLENLRPSQSGAARGVPSVSSVEDVPQDLPQIPDMSRSPARSTRSQSRSVSPASSVSSQGQSTAGRGGRKGGKRGRPKGRSPARDLSRIEVDSSVAATESVLESHDEVTSSTEMVEGKSGHVGTYNLYTVYYIRRLQKWWRVSQAM